MILYCYHKIYNLLFIYCIYRRLFPCYSMFAYMERFMIMLNFVLWLQIPISFIFHADFNQLYLAHFHSVRLYTIIRLLITYTIIRSFDLGIIISMIQHISLIELILIELTIISLLVLLARAHLYYLN